MADNSTLGQGVVEAKGGRAELSPSVGKDTAASQCRPWAEAEALFEEVEAG
jgi:hypothetical protein